MASWHDLPTQKCARLVERHNGDAVAQLAARQQCLGGRLSIHHHLHMKVQLGEETFQEVTPRHPSSTVYMAFTS